MTEFSRISHCPDCGAETAEGVGVEPKKHFHKDCIECNFKVSNIDCPCKGYVTPSEI